MKGSTLKYAFWTLSVLILVLILLTSRNAGITCDEVLHYNQSQSVYNYFATGGEDRSSLSNPVWHLMYYGQSFDNLVTIIINWLGIEDVYGFRHIMSSLAGWLTMMVTALFAIWLSGYRSGIVVMLLFAITPAFMGHSHNNLKDIPFALGYISSTFFLIKLLYSDRRFSGSVTILLTLSIALTISIRAAGMVLICYMYFFILLFYIARYFKDGYVDRKEIIFKLLLITCISFISYFLSILLWPYALQDPLRNVIKAYQVMTHYPDTFRQLFEGKAEWSDFMPWYYLPKSMVITIPLLVLSGLIVFLLLIKQTLRNNKWIIYAFILFSLLFPVLFAIYEKSNLYSSWRQFLFIYPALVLLASEGFNFLYESVSKKYLRWAVMIMFAFLAIHPVSYMIKNQRYFYLYYNQITGGLRGAWSNYETDYYYVSQTEASEWLIDYLENKTFTDKVKVNATYSVHWQFRNHPQTETSYFRYEERSQSDWDYAIVVNRYISPYKLRNGIWPPGNAIHIIYADSVPICAVLERKSKDAYYGYLALSEGKNGKAVNYFEKALEFDDKDEMIFYNFAAALYNLGEKHKADSLLKECLEINPEFEPALMYVGNIAMAENRNDEAMKYYEKLIDADRKYFEAYVALSGIVLKTDLMRARKLLRTCLTMNPGYKPAIKALADTYRGTDPDIAEKYDELADSVK
ncbi:MAG: hypothetical protein A2X05_10065 [Bacteroidetes bacterium GWE2_41_25]|nr:MAG: hypothetical protein A2X05_10065 [Bacteroidetes bacterium GWE2_41_25]HCU19595.1 hypothetical protein [Bacteroidales bacterium]